VSSLLPRISLPIVIALLVTAALPAAAQSWTGAGPDDNWTTGANWAGGVPPASGPATQLTFPASAPRRSPLVDSPWTVNQVFFLGSYTMTGQAVTFDGLSAAILALGSTVTFSNPIVLAAPTTIGGSSGIFILNGPVSGSGSLTASAATGAITLRGANTFTGGTIVGAGPLILEGSMPGPVTVDSAGIFTGSGTVNGAVTVSGAGAILRGGPVISTGNLSMAASTTLSMSIDGPAAGQYQSINVTGAVDISDARLTLSGAYTPALGDTFVVVTNDGTDAVAGTFAGLPEGATATFNGVPLRISYVGGSGNDITLTAIAALAADVVQVPTLSEWALILLAAIIGTLGLSRTRRP